MKQTHDTYLHAEALLPATAEHCEKLERSDAAFTFWRGETCYEHCTLNPWI